MSAMHRAIRQGSVDKVKALLATEPALASRTDAQGRNALHLAAVQGCVDLVRLVLPHVDPNALDQNQRSALHWATACGHPDCIALLVESGCDPASPDAHGAFPIHYAARPGGEPTAAAAGLRCLGVLLRKGGTALDCEDSGGKTALLWAASAGNARACRLLVELTANANKKDNDGLTALHCATYRNHPDCVKTLLADCQCDPNAANSMGCTPLFYALFMNLQDCARALLENGASPDWMDQDGKSPAYCAATKGSVPLLKLLHDHRGSLHLRTSTGDTPLLQAARAGHTDAVSFLLEHGCSVANRDAEKCTALHHAALQDKLPLCTLLVNHGANVNAVCKRQQVPLTPLDLAEAEGNTVCMDYLLSLGARRCADIPEKLWQCEEGQEEEEEEEVQGEKEEEVRAEDSGGASPDPKTPDTQDLQRKLNNWNAYLRDNVEFLDVIIGSRAPELAGARAQAKNQRRELVGRLGELRAELEGTFRRLAEEVERRENGHEERSTLTLRRLRDLEERCQRANASAAASLNEYEAARLTPPEIPLTPHGERRHSDSEFEVLTGDDRTCSGRNNGGWMQTDGSNKKRSTRSDDEAGSDSDRKTAVIISRSGRQQRNVPDYRTVKSPYNAKVILPLRMADPRPLRSYEGRLSGREQADIRRRTGDINMAALVHSKRAQPKLD